MSTVKNPINILLRIVLLQKNYSLVLPTLTVKENLSKTCFS